jgi:DNA-binding MarR family transcriptional regulator
LLLDITIEITDGKAVDPVTRTAKSIDNPLTGHAGFHLRRASSVIMADLSERLAELDLRPADASTLILIGANPGITQSKIGAALGIQRANMAPMAARLTERGLIAGAPVDGRSIGFRLTAEGQTVTAGARTRMEQHDARFMDALNPEERQYLIALLISIAKKHP